MKKHFLYYAFFPHKPIVILIMFFLSIYYTCIKVIFKCKLQEVLQNWAWLSIGKIS